jgi:hypothetical protein
LSNLVDAAICLEVGHELDYGGNQMGAIAVLTGGGQGTQLLVGSCQHLQALESSHGQGQVPLGLVETLDVGRHVGDGSLGVERSRAHAIDATKDVSQLFFCTRDTAHTVGIALCLARLHAAHVLMQLMLLFVQLLRYGGGLVERRCMSEEGVQMCDGVVLDCISCQSLVRP